MFLVVDMALVTLTISCWMYNNNALFCRPCILQNLLNMLPKHTVSLAEIAGIEDDDDDANEYARHLRREHKVARWQHLIPFFASPHPPPWRNPRKGRDQILLSGNLADATPPSSRGDRRRRQVNNRNHHPWRHIRLCQPHGLKHKLWHQEWKQWVISYRTWNK